MIKSMTGYGKAEAILENGKLTIEIRTLNGKSADINLKTALLPKDKELGIRQKLAEKLQRGTIDFFTSWEQGQNEGAKTINASLVKDYYRQISEIQKGLFTDCDAKCSPSEILASILKMPDVVEAKRDELITENNWSKVDQAIDEAIQAVNDYRSNEGVSLYKDVTSRIQKILGLYDEVESLENERIEAVRSRLLKNLEELRQKYDESRFEQEMIFYLEKLDINEEKVRLRQHCKYFMDTIDSEEYPGKKLGFIIQEMGREINTTGSKANHSGIQKAVVRMKDELEKIREQSMNIL